MNITAANPMGEAGLRRGRFCRRVMIAIFGLAVPMGLRAAPQFVGVNLAGAEFTPNQLPGTYNTHYTYPTTAEVDARLASIDSSHSPPGVALTIAGDFMENSASRQMHHV